MKKETKKETKKQTKKVKYYSTDKMYIINNKKSTLNLKFWRYFLLILSSVLLFISAYFIKNSVIIGGLNNDVTIKENGNTDFVVYLKDNNFYDSKFLHSGMQYVASLINTINTSFKYDIKSDEELDMTYNYRIVGDLRIIDRNEKRLLYTKNEILLEKNNIFVKDNKLTVNEDVIIDYDKYNNLVNQYKSNFGVPVNAELVLTMYVDIDGKTNIVDEKYEKNGKLQIVIPLSEQTINIDINNSVVKNTDYLSTVNGVKVTNILMLILGGFLLGLSVIGYAVDIEIFKEYNQKNIYSITVGKILRDYDRLIVSGKVEVNEKDYKNIIKPENFSEMVDASENLNSPILYYEVIPGEKCFFIIINGNTLYKYRLTKAYLEKEQEKKNK